MLQVSKIAEELQAYSEADVNSILLYSLLLMSPHGEQYVSSSLMLMRQQVYHLNL